MTLQIRMMMYSGVRDPQWTIDGAQEQEFRRLITSPAFDTAAPTIPWRIGYRGFVVIDLAAPDQPPLRVRRHSMPSFEFFGAPEVEQFLLRTGPEDELPFPPDTVFPKAQPMEISAHIRTPRAPRVAEVPGTWRPSRAADAPNWDPDDPKWTGTNQYNNHCLNYAANQQLSGWADPGNTSHNRQQSGIMSGCQLLSGLLSDGFRRTDRFPWDRSLVAGEGHYICLVITPGMDMHFYRQDSNGWWSHKNGANRHTNLDDSGKLIADPRFCDRSSLTQFVAFLTVPPSAIITAFF